MGTESLANRILVSTECKVANEEGVRRRVLRVTELLSTVVGALLWCGVVARGREIDIGLTTINHGTLLGRKSSSTVGGLVELNVAKALGSTRVTVGNDTGSRNLTKLLELTVQPLVVDVPAQVTNEQVLGSRLVDSFNLGLLCGGNGLIVGLALLRWRLGLGFSLALTLARLVGVFLLSAAV